MLGAITGTVADIAILVGMALLFVAAAAPVGPTGLRFLPPAIGAYSLAGMSTFDPFYWPRRVRYVDQLSVASLVAIVAASLVVGILVWWHYLPGAVATLVLVVGLIIIGFSVGAH